MTPLVNGVTQVAARIGPWHSAATSSPGSPLLRTLLVLSLVVVSACRSAVVVEPIEIVEPVEPVETVTVLSPFESEDGRMGYRDQTGKVHIEAKYDHASEFTPEGIAWVASSSGLQWIDRSGVTLAQAYVYDNGPDPFVEGRSRILSGGLVGFIDPTGRIVVPATFDFLMPMENGRAQFCDGCVQVFDGEHSNYEGGYSGYIDANGVVLPPAPEPDSAPAPD